MLSGIQSNESYSSYLRSQALSRSDPTDMFGQIDTDDSSGISQTELEDWIGAMSAETGVGIDTTDAVTTWDEDGDGELGSEELGAFMQDTLPPPPGMMGMGPEASAEGLFQALDSDESSGISESELSQWAGSMSEETGETLAVSEAFADYDLDGDGELSAQELDSLLTANSVAGSVSASSDDEEDEEGTSGSSASSSISAYDTNGDGVLSGDELRAYLEDTQTASPIENRRQAISSYTTDFGSSDDFNLQDIFMNQDAAGAYSPVNTPA